MDRWKAALINNEGNSLVQWFCAYPHFKSFNGILGFAQN